MASKYPHRLSTSIPPSGVGSVPQRRRGAGRSLKGKAPEDPRAPSSGDFLKLTKHQARYISQIIAPPPNQSFIVLQRRRNLHLGCPLHLGLMPIPDRQKRCCHDKEGQRGQMDFADAARKIGLGLGLEGLSRVPKLPVVFEQIPGHAST
jgi:hypothetical protein